MKTTGGRPLVLYRLHFEPKVGRFQHYIGSTFIDRLQKRLDTHMRGRGARLTSRAVQQGAAVYLCAVEPLLDRKQEHQIKRLGHYERACPICNGTSLLYPPLTLSGEALSAPEWDALQY